MFLNLQSIRLAICSTPLVGVIALTLGSSLPASPGTITLDEFGNGDLDGASIPFQLHPALSYQLPFAVRAGDVILVDGGVPEDVIRFRGRTVFFYSDIADGAESLADTGLPKRFKRNQVVLNEDSADDGTEMTSYTPSRGQPGFSGRQDLDYQFISDPAGADTATPEPESLLLLPGALVGLALRKVLSKSSSR